MAPLQLLAVHRNFVHKSNEPDQLQITALAETNTHWEQVWLTAFNANQAHAAFRATVAQMVERVVWEREG